MWICIRKNVIDNIFYLVYLYEGYFIFIIWNRKFLTTMYAWTLCQMNDRTNQTYVRMLIFVQWP